MNAGQVGAVEHRIPHLGPGPRYEVDDAGWQAGFLKQPHDVPGRVDGRRRRLPEHGAAGEGRRRGQVAADGREVEGRNGEYESLEGPVLQAVPDARRGSGLVAHELRQVADVEPPEVDQFAGRVDLRLEDRLGLAQHGRGVDRLSPGPGQQVGRLHDDRRPLLPGHVRPRRPGFEGRIDGHADLGFAGLVIYAEVERMVMGRPQRRRVARLHLPAADDQRDLDGGGFQFSELRLDGRSFVRSGRVFQDRFVVGPRGVETCVGHNPYVSGARPMCQLFCRPPGGIQAR